ncbi:sel1 repeat family protein [Roseobacter sp. HKCCA0434]|uniref:tetratricopeptide repeat protein n=1 Tax=Roseobacter sp. HKCCA0434 TaxID=3079297 RepID=UPI002905BAFE|nr:sel1 repeat family protein [Roseobacter sp. HKCCA0434]
MRSTLIVATMLATVSPVLADDDPYGQLNPDEMTWQSFRDRAERGETGMVLCSMGYAMTKSGDHDTARLLFRNCADAGYTGAMNWMGQLDNNGLGGPYDPDAAAEWDRRAAEAGDPVGQFNYGIALMRGHGVARDEAAGRALVDRAAGNGLDIAERLRGADYDLDAVTPDADDWRYAPLF